MNATKLKKRVAEIIVTLNEIASDADVMLADMDDDKHTDEIEAIGNACENCSNELSSLID